MDLLDLLPADHVVVPLRAPNVRDAIRQVLERLVEAGAVVRSEALEQRIMHGALREAIAVNDDVVIPHYRSDSVKSLVIGLGIAPDPIPADDPALDIQPRIVALVLAPQDAPGSYLRTTSTLARLLRQPEVVNMMARQPDAAAVLALPPLQDLHIRPSLAVRDVMVHRVHSVAPDATLGEVMTLMLRRRLRAVPVVGPKGEVLGMVTDSDLMRTLLPQIPRAEDEHATPVAVADRPARDIMTRSVLCVSEDLGIGEVASMMINKDVEQVPVVSAGAITGMVARGDIIRKLFASH